MATTYSPLWRIAELTPLDPGTANTWGTILTDSVPLFEEGAVGITAVSINGLTSYTLSTANNASDQARYLVQQYTGALTGNCTVTIPNEPKIGYQQNSTTGGFSVIVSAGAGTTATIPPDGNWYLIAMDGATNVELVPVGFAAAEIAGNLTVGGNATVTGTLGVTGLATFGTVDASDINVATLSASASSAFNATGTALQVPNGSSILNTLSTTGAVLTAVTGFALTPSGTGPVSNNFNVGISCNSSMLAGNYFAVSDERRKTQIEPITPEDARRWLNATRPVTYLKDDRPEAGFIAQEQARAGFGQYINTTPNEALPEIVHEDGSVSKAGYELSLNYDNYIAYLTAALKSALARIEALEKASGVV